MSLKRLAHPDNRPKVDTLSAFGGATENESLKTSSRYVAKILYLRYAATCVRTTRNGEMPAPAPFSRQSARDTGSVAQKGYPLRGLSH